MAAQVVLSIDIGGKSIKTGYVDATGLIKACEPCPLPSSLQPDTVARVLREQAERGIAMAANEAFDIVAVGVGSPGLVDPETGNVREATNLQWGSFALRDFLEERTGKPVFVEHDVRSGAIAEKQFGALQGIDDFLYIAIGTGIGAAISIGGRLRTGATGMGGEFGHTIIVPEGRECGCGRRGCLEAYCSARHIELRYQEETGVPLTSFAIAERARTGDPCAMSIWRDAANALAYALVNYHTLLEPTTVVIGGGVAAAGETLLLQPVRSRMQQIVKDMTLPDIRVSGLREHSALIGAGYQAWVRYLSLREESA